jgi:hypothetical protein
VPELSHQLPPFITAYASRCGGGHRGELRGEQSTTRPYSMCFRFALSLAQLGPEAGACLELTSIGLIGATTEKAVYAAEWSPELCAYANERVLHPHVECSCEP